MTPVEHYVQFARYQPNHHFVPENHGMELLRANHNLRWLFPRDPTAIFRHPLEDHLCALFRVVMDGTDFGWLHSTFGENWGRYATYLELCAPFWESWHGLIRGLPYLPPSRPGAPVVLLIRGALRPIHRSTYTVSLRSDYHDTGFNEALMHPDPSRGYFGDESTLIKAFIHLAEARGYKVGFTIVTSNEQLLLDGKPFDWTSDHHYHVLLGKLLHAISLGFRAIHWDSIKHMGGFDNWGHYHVFDGGNYGGRGVPIPYEKFATLTQDLRRMSGHNDLSFVGEYAGADDRYRAAGLTAGIDADALLRSPEEIHRHAAWQAESGTYRTGFFSSNDNTRCRHFHEVRAALGRALCDQPSWSRCATLTTQSDLFPLNTDYHRVADDGLQWWWENCLFHPSAADERRQLNEVYISASYK